MYREFALDDRFAPFVECGWLRSGSSALSIRVIPDGCVDIFVTAQGEVMIAGPADTFFDLPTGDHDVLAGLRIRPGAAAVVIGCPASEFVNQRRALDSALGLQCSWIADSVLSAPSPQQRIARLEAAFATYFARNDPVADSAVARAVRALRLRPGQRISTLASHIGVSERQLRRRFEAAVGYGPKRLGRVFRLQRLLDVIQASGGWTTWSQVAVAAGYTDQSHMINECVALTGGPPTALPVSVLSNTDPGYRV